MNKRVLPFGIVAALTILSAFALTCPSLAQTQDRGKVPEKHDSNTLHKIGKVIQYPFRKAGENTSKTAHKTGKAVQYPVRKTAENTSVTAHRVTGKNSVVRRKNGRRRFNTVVTPKGHLYRIHHRRHKK